jgi:hypothetical protein
MLGASPYMPRCMKDGYLHSPARPPTAGLVWCSRDRRADDCNADNCDADVLALAEPGDGSHATAGSGYVYRMGVSTRRIRHVRRRQPAPHTHYMCMYTYILQGHSRGTFPSTHRVLLRVLSGQVGTHVVLSEQTGTHGVLSGQVGRCSRGTASARLRNCAWYSRRACTCAHARACAAEYVLGAANTNACLAGYSKITDVPTCQAAAAAVGNPYGGAAAHISRPGGCFLDTGNPSKVDFNLNATGAAFAFAQPLCRFGAPRVRGCVYSFRVLTVGSIYVLAGCSHGDVFSTAALNGATLTPAVVRHVCAADYVYGTADTATQSVHGAHGT